jgi:hypothetical protein
MIIAIAMSAASGADGPPPAAVDQVGAARAREFLMRARQDAAGYEIHLQDGDRALECQADPVLQWSNPVLGEVYGGVFLWTRDGRPEAAAAIFKWYSPHTHRTHEFQSLSTSGITASRDGQQVWATARHGVEFQAVPGAPAPAETRAGRQLQVRMLARQFSAEITERDGVVHTLRLLPQPIYRYESPGDKRNDGALFAFALGTDPDVLLLIESRSADGLDAWHYAPARMNWQDMRVRHDEQVVWEVGRLSSSEAYRGTEPYAKFQFDDAP